MDEDGKEWFVAADLVKVLGFRDPYVATRYLDDDEKLLHSISVAGQNRETTLVSESGMYALVFKSRKPEAKRFKKWVTDDVLPTIRKTGSYSLAPDPVAIQQYYSDFTNLGKLLIDHGQMIEKNKQLEATVWVEGATFWSHLVTFMVKREFCTVSTRWQW